MDITKRNMIKWLEDLELKPYSLIKTKEFGDYKVNIEYIPTSRPYIRERYK